MKTSQYTVRNIPEQVDRYLRKRAQLSGQSLNQVILDELSDRAGADTSSLVDSLSWFVGSGMDEQTLEIIKEEDAQQKKLAKKELADAV